MSNGFPEGRQRAAPTIRDVAAKAGVSISTVSHTLSGKRPISEATRLRVLEAIDALNYSTNALAASMRRGRSGLIGMIIRPRDAIRGSLGGTDNFLRLIGAAAVRALEQGLGLVHVPNTSDGFDATLPVEGYIVASPYFEDAVLVQALRTGLPVVTIDGVPEDPNVDPGWNVRVDYESGVAQALSQLTDLERTPAALIIGTEENQWRRAIRSTVAEVYRDHLELLTEIELYEGEGVAGAAVTAESLLDHGFRRFLVAASRFGVGVSQAAQARGLSVPKDVEIVSFTDSRMAEVNHPPLTAVDLMLDEAGHRGVELLIARLEGRTVEPRTVATEVHRRGSTR
ncbi:LacI family DNA-binding transcriptional regulator [Leucobacter tenebrionis]|uniref:LacI family DNA-binding transcriptional regulator n=1 Tax=Leucobacter tenebrionis TaxID=2873270 RepID=UPI001CA79671|nr:LacI family DNA-binding transcriptional regulator [Leucobacter tenebrionis]QZY50888.1 LacI family transcriptional regulator [Leucobacter tenebrionis]